MDDGSQVGDEEAKVDGDGGLAAMKSRRKTLRRQITMANKQIESLISVRGSREAVRGLVRHVEGLLLQGTRLHSEILEIEDDDEEAERQDSTHLTYITRSSELATAAQVYLRSREEDAESAVGQNVVPIPEPPVDPAEAQRREQARQEEMTNALQRAQQARERVDQAWHEADEATNALRLLGIANPKEYLQPDEDQLTDISFIASVEVSRLACSFDDCKALCD
uniref:Uncharacterized protein n=1 Tax=Daphnia galeata TaxID=27404 RepID=A0A8J2RB01_9CRUS|nr:unnamed protein product [Daphnia galeata]